LAVKGKEKENSAPSSTSESQIRARLKSTLFMFSRESLIVANSFVPSVPGQTSSLPVGYPVRGIAKLNH